MEDLTTIILLVFGLFGLLNLILFFKIWGMTNDVREIKEKYLSHKYVSTEEYTNTEEYKGQCEIAGKFKPGDLVVVKMDETQFRVGEVEEIEGIFYYSDMKENKPGKYTDSEIELFDVYWGNKKR